MFNTVGASVDEPQTEQPDPIDGKNGLELVEHVMFYGASLSELEELDREQIATLKAAGLVE